MSRTAEAAEPKPPATRSLGFSIGLAIVTLVGFAWRLGFTLVTKGSDTNLTDEGDAFYYSFVARNLAAGNWFVNPFNGAPAADHPPLTVAVLGPTSWLFTDSILAQRLTMTVIGTGVIVAVGLLGRYLAGPVAGLVAAGVAAANPNFWMNDALIMSESLSALLIVASLASGWSLARKPTVVRSLIAGATVGLTVLARAEMGLLLPLMVLPLLLRAKDLGWTQKAGRLAVAGMAALVMVAPWSLVNLGRFEDPVLMSTNDGTTLLGSNCPETYYGGIIGSWSIRCVLDVEVDGLDGSQASARQRDVAVEYIKAHKEHLPAVLLAREGRTFGFLRPDQQAYSAQGEGRPSWATWAGFGAFWFLIPISVIGTLELRRRQVTLVPVVASLATVVLVSALFYGIARFRLPLDVAMTLLAGVAAARWIKPRWVGGGHADGSTAASTPTMSPSPSTPR